jgi:hypothetical protein
MAIIITLVAHLLTIAGLGLLTAFVFRFVLDPQDLVERFLRTVALVTGFLIYFASTAVGLSIPELMLESLRVSHPAALGVVSVALPSGIGAAVAAYCIRCLRKDERGNIAVRLMIMVTTFVIVLFAEAYAISRGADGVQVGLHLLPNVSFTIGLALYFVLRYDSIRSLRREYAHRHVL